MFNYVMEKLYEKYETKRCDDNTIDFIERGKIVATLYPKEAVINIFLKASSKVIFNHYNLAILVIAKKYPVLTNGKRRITEAAWVIGCCGATREYNFGYFDIDFELPMYLGTGKGFKPEEVLAISNCYIGDKGNIWFQLFDMRVEWKEAKQPYPNPKPFLFLNPALIYPVKKGGKKIPNANKALRRVYYAVFGSGNYTRTILEIEEAIDKLANKVNHADFSQISYYRRSKK